MSVTFRAYAPDFMVSIASEFIHSFRTSVIQTEEEEEEEEEDENAIDTELTTQATDATMLGSMSSWVFGWNGNA